MGLGLTDVNRKGMNMYESKDDYLTTHSSSSLLSFSISLDSISPSWSSCPETDLYGEEIPSRSIEKHDKEGGCPVASSYQQSKAKEVLMKHKETAMV